MSYFLFSQVIVGMSFILDVSAFHFKKRTTALRVLALSTLLISMHFILLDKMSASLMMFLACCRFIVASLTSSRAYRSMFMILSVVGGIFTWQNFSDILPLAGGLVMNYAAFQKEELKLRYFTMLGSAFWIANNVIAHSPVAVVMEASFFFSTAYSLMRKIRKVKDVM